MDESYMMKTMFITSNIASVFESAVLRENWFSVITTAIEDRDPNFVVFHFQEVGGLLFKESRGSIDTFLKQFLDLPILSNFDRIRVFIDNHYEAQSDYTSLGCVYLVHSRVAEASVWNFQSGSFEVVTGRDIQVLHPGCEIGPHYQMKRFPNDFYTHIEWTRKGYVWSRWLINGMTLDFVNLHLFHDQSNLVSIDATPSTYFHSRKRALDWVFSRIFEENLSEAPLVIFGDFNFRVDLCSIVKEVRAASFDVDETRSPDGYLQELMYRSDNEDDVPGKEPLLRLGPKVFDMGSRQKEFITHPVRWAKYDIEPSFFRDRVFELPVTFPPSYRFVDSEALGSGSDLSLVRAPSWCDRILLSNTTRSFIAQERHLSPEYGLLGLTTPLGDHKPVFLCLHLRQTPGDHLVLSSSEAQH